MKLFSDMARLSGIVFLSVFMGLVASGCGKQGPEAAAEQVKEARQLLSEGKPRHALIKLKEIIRLDPENADARLMMGSLFLLRGDALSAEIELRKAKQAGAKRNQWIIPLADALLGQGKYQQLINDLNPVAEDSEKTRALLTLTHGEAYLGLKNHTQARKRFEDARQYEEAKAGALMGLAKIHRAENDNTGALVLYDQALKEDPAEINALMAKGNIYLHANLFDKAKLQFDEVISKQAKYYPAYLKRSLVLLSVGKVDQAAEDLKIFKESVKTSPLANFLEARLHFLKGENSLANDKLQEVLRSDVNIPAAHLLQAYIAITNGWHRQAEQALRRYMAKKPDDYIHTKFLAALELKLGNAEGAISRLTNRTRGVRPDHEALAILGVANLANDKQKRGFEALKLAWLYRSDLPGMSIIDAADNQQGGQDTLDPSVLQTDRQVYKKFIRDVMLEKAESWLSGDIATVEKYYQAGLVSLVNEKYERAEKYFNDAIARDKKHNPSHTGLAMLAIQNKALQKAEQILAANLSRKPSDEESLILMVRLQEAQKKRKQAVSWLQKGWKHNYGSLKTGLPLLREYLRSKRVSAASAVEKKIKAKHATNPGVYRVMGKIYLSFGDNKRALSLFQQGMKHDRTVQNHFMAASVYVKMNQAQKALGIYDSILQQSVNFLPALVAKAKLLTNMNRLDQAGLTADKVVKLYPDKAIGYQLQALLEKQQGNMVKSEDLLVHALSLQPGNDRLVIELVNVLGKNGKQAESELLLRNRLFNDRHNNKLRLVLASVLQNHGKRKQAIEEYLELESRSVYLVAVLNNLVWLFNEQGDSRLDEYIAKIEKLNVRSPEIMDTIGWVYLQQGKTDKASEYILSAANKLPNNLGVQYHAAVYYQKTGNKNKARKILKKILSSKVAFAEREQAQKTLDQL